MRILTDHPAKTVYAIEGRITLDNDKGYVRTLSTPVFLKSLPRDRYEYIRSFTIGIDTDTGEVFAFGNGSCLTAEQQAKTTALGVSIGDTLDIEGALYRVEPDYNSNIKLVRA